MSHWWSRKPAPRPQPRPLTVDEQRDIIDNQKMSLDMHKSQLLQDARENELNAEKAFAKGNEAQGKAFIANAAKIQGFSKVIDAQMQQLELTKPMLTISDTQNVLNQSVAMTNRLLSANMQGVGPMRQNLRDLRTNTVQMGQNMKEFENIQTQMSDLLGTLNEDTEDMAADIERRVRAKTESRRAQVPVPPTVVAEQPMRQTVQPPPVFMGT